MPPKSDVTYKVLIVGEAAVGKTALLKSLMGDQFSESMLPTIGIDFVKKTFPIDGALVELQIWDTAGQERFKTITKFQFRGTQGILLVYDITNENSFEAVNYWLDSIEHEVVLDHATETVPIHILGNKCDLEEKRIIPSLQGKQKADEFYVRDFMETSAKTKTNVDEAFEKLAYNLVDMYNPKLMSSYKGKPQNKTPEETREGTTNEDSNNSKDIDKVPKGSKIIKVTKNNKKTSCANCKTA